MVLHDRVLSLIQVRFSPTQRCIVFHLDYVSYEFKIGSVGIDLNSVSANPLILSVFPCLRFTFLGMGWRFPECSVTVWCGVCVWRSEEKRPGVSYDWPWCSVSHTHPSQGKSLWCMKVYTSPDFSLLHRASAECAFQWDHLRKEKSFFVFSPTPFFWMACSFKFKYYRLVSSISSLALFFCALMSLSLFLSKCRHACNILRTLILVC